MRFSLFARSLIVVGSVLAVVTIAFDVWHASNKSKRQTTELEARVEELTKVQAVSVANALWDLNRDSVSQILKSLEQDLDFFEASIITDSGEVFARIGKKITGATPVVTSQADIKITEGGASRTIGVLNLSLSKARLLQRQRGGIWNALILGIIQLLTVILVTALTLKRILGPLETITNRLLTLASGDTEQAIPNVGRNDQIGDMARAVGDFRDNLIEIRKLRVEDAKMTKELAEARDKLEDRVEERTKELKDSEDRFRRAIHDSPIPIIMHAEDGEVMMLSNKWVELSGYSLSDIPTIYDWTEKAFRTDKKRMKHQKKTIQAGYDLKKSCQHDAYITKASGEQRTWEVHNAPLGQLPDGRRFVISMALDITERKELEEARREVERQFQAIVDNSPSAILLKDTEGRYLLANRKWNDWFNPEGREIAGKTVHDFQSTDYADKVTAIDHEVVETGATVSREQLTPRAGGTQIPTILQKFPVLDGNGKVIAIGGVNTDITEIKQAQKAAEKSEGRMIDAIESLSDGFIYYDSERRLVYCNDRYREFYPWIADLLVPGARLDDLARVAAEWGQDAEPIDDVEAWVEARLDAFERGHKGYEQVLQSGRSLLCSDSRSHDGGYVGIRTDISKLKEIETELSEQESRLRTALKHMTGGIFMFDADLRIQIASPSFQEFYEFPADMVVPGASAIDLMEFRVQRGDYGPGDHDKILAERIKIYRSRKPATVEDKAPDGRLMELHLSPMPDGGVVGVFNDIAERNKTRDALIAAKGEAETASHAKSQFLAAVSHELRTPLNAILGFSQILKGGYFGPLGDKKYRECAEDIDSSGEHLLALVDDLLDISTIEAGEQSLARENLFTNEIITECVKLVADKARIGGIDLTARIPEDLPPLYADFRATKQILINLLSNAIKFTPEGGKITVSAKATRKDTTIKVADSGKGIPPDILPKLTNMFIRAESDAYVAQKGWGLGLSITQSLIDLHDGKMDIRSKVGKGTTVTVTLPNGTP